TPTPGSPGTSASTATPWTGTSPRPTPTSAPATGPTPSPSLTAAATSAPTTSQPPTSSRRQPHDRADAARGAVRPRERPAGGGRGVGGGGPRKAVRRAAGAARLDPARSA